MPFPGSPTFWAWPFWKREFSEIRRSRQQGEQSYYNYQVATLSSSGCHSSSSVFVTNIILSGMQNHCKIPNQRVAIGQNVCLCSSSSDGLVQKWLFHDGFHTKQQHFTLRSAPVTLKSHEVEVVQNSHWRTMASFAMPFSSLVGIRKEHLATKHNYYSRSLI